jgi:hypothetical protein
MFPQVCNLALMETLFDMSHDWKKDQGVFMMLG